MNCFTHLIHPSPPKNTQTYNKGGKRSHEAFLDDLRGPSKLLLIHPLEGVGIHINDGNVEKQETVVVVVVAEMKI